MAQCCRCAGVVHNRAHQEDLSESRPNAQWARLRSGCCWLRLGCRPRAAGLTATRKALLSRSLVGECSRSEREQGCHKDQIDPCPCIVAIRRARRHAASGRRGHPSVEIFGLRQDDGHRLGVHPADCVADITMGSAPSATSRALMAGWGAGDCSSSSAFPPADPTPPAPRMSSCGLRRRQSASIYSITARSDQNRQNSAGASIARSQSGRRLLAPHCEVPDFASARSGLRLP
jgi:hypothetical protein